MKKQLKILLSVFVGITFCFAQTNPAQHHANFALDCQECHVCKKPTFEEPCLKLFPEFKRTGITMHHTADEAPELLKIDVMSNIYEASIFTHKLHAEMSEMSGGCISCHHFNPPGKIVGCKNCHEASINRTDLQKPGLKGAFHRQCMACHQDWSHESNCEVCHTLKKTETSETSLTDKKEFVGKSHPKIKEPDKLVYNTDMDEGPVVTFFHNEHVHLFNIGCVNCHKNESCIKCHDTEKHAVMEKDDPHQYCVDCHEAEIDDNCNKCHAQNEKKGFEHASTGWVLNRFHNELQCRACHGNSGNFTGLKKQCVACHRNWEPGKFDHKVTGLDLDENHIEEDCDSCHADKRFTKKTLCSDCHDGYMFPKQKPGKLVSSAH